MRNTEFIATALGLPGPAADAPLAPALTSCAVCGRVINKGDVCHPKVFSDAFMDDAWLISRSKAYCHYCASTISASFSLKSKNCLVVSAEGAYPISKDPERAWFLLNPPKPPFVMTASKDVNFQHVLWKTPLTETLDNIYVGWPTRIMTINHSRLLAAVEACRVVAAELTRIATEGQPGKKAKKAKDFAYSHPYIFLDRDLSDGRHGQLMTSALELRSNPVMKTHIDLLQNLSLGETWALATLVKRKTEIPECPPPLTATLKQKKEIEND